MHPLSVWPHLFSYPFLAYFVLRLLVAFNTLRFGLVRRKKSWKVLAWLEYLASILVFFGLYTQPGLVLVIVSMFLEYIADKKYGVADCKDEILMLIISVVAFALLFLGPGSFAFDLPL